MPMNKDLTRKGETQKVKSAADFTIERQQARFGREPRHVEPRGPDTPPPGPKDGANKSETVKDDAILNSNPIHDVDDLSLSVQKRRESFNPHKISAPGLPPKYVGTIRDSQLRPDMPHSKQQKSSGGTSVKQQKPKEELPISTFDNTTSIGSSFLNDSDLDVEHTTIYKPRPPSATSLGHSIKPSPNSKDVFHMQSNTDRINLARAIGGDNWQTELVDERTYQEQQLRLIPDPTEDRSTYGTLKGNKERHTKEIFVDLEAQPDTPSRTQSVPPRPHLLAPVARNPNKSVEFAPTPDLFSGDQPSPAFLSADIEREDNDSVHEERPSSVEATSINATSQQQSRPLQDKLNNRYQEVYTSASAHNSRFPKMVHHQTRIMKQDEKVSAPDSDMQESSDDETGKWKSKSSVKDRLPQRSQDVTTAGQKRSYDESDDLDYDTKDLKDKTLSELQRDPFNKDPRDPSRTPVRDNHGNEMNLSQILDNLSKMTPDAQQEIFRMQTDDEWAQTGQWFVDRFQSHLKELIQTRLERRKVALKFEDRIRRRHKEVQHYQAGVQKELSELQEGGQGLLKDRKVGVGSRSGTPVKTGRP